MTMVMAMMVLLQPTMTVHYYQSVREALQALARACVVDHQGATRSYSDDAAAPAAAAAPRPPTRTPRSAEWCWYV